MGFSEFHIQAAQHLQTLLQVQVYGYNTLCSCTIKNRICEIVFKGTPKVETHTWTPQEAVIDYFIPLAPKTPQNHKRRVVAVSSDVVEAANIVAEEIKRLSQTSSILVYKTKTGWQAQLEDKHAVWAAGKTHLEALGDLLLNHADHFGVEVQVRN